MSYFITPEKDKECTIREKEEDALLVWADIDDHLQYAERVIQRSDLQSHLRGSLLDRVHRIRARSADPYMYFAVVGEFNTGKSTFINALLREELLQTSAVVATATSTRICYRDKVDFEVCFRQINKVFRFETDREQIWLQLLKYAPSLRGNTRNIKTYIQALTANNEVAPHVKHMEIYHPTAFLSNNTIIIDTPGINAEYQAHRQMTNQVVQHEADAAAILIPAPIPLSQTLVEFVAESLRPYLHRCVFIVTQMDKVPQREHTRLLESIKKRLITALDIKHPMLLYASAPQVVLDVIQQQPVAEEMKYWAVAFEQLEQKIWDHLRQERALSITESLLRLMEALFEELGKYLREHQSAYTTQQEALHRETIQDIAAFTLQQQRSYKKTIGKRISSSRYSIVSAIARQSETAQKEVRQAIFGVESASSLKSTMEQAVQSVMEKARTALQLELRNQGHQLQNKTSSASRDFDRRFAQEYRKLEVLAESISFTGVQPIGDDLSLNALGISYSAGKVNDELDSNVEKLGWGGAAAGAMIGTFILPGVGTVLGAMFGSVLIGIFGPSLDDRKTKVWDEVSSAMKTAFQKMESDILTDFDRYGEGVQQSFERRISRYMQHYKNTVDAMIINQKKESEKIQQAQKSIQVDQQEIERRRASLKEKQRQLMEKSR